MKSLTIRSRVRAAVKAVAAEWQIRRINIPRSLLDTIEADVRTVVRNRTLGLLNPSPPPQAN